MSSVVDFSLTYQKSGVELDPLFIEAATKEDLPVELCWTPNNWYAAIAAAGQILRKDPTQHLANSPVRKQFHLGHKNVLQTYLTDIVNASITPVHSNDPYTSFNCSGAKKLDTCRGAEISYCSTFKALEVFGSHEYQIGYTIFRNAQWGAVALRKHFGEPSTLSLVDIVINGIPYPAGSFFRADLAHEDTFDGDKAIKVLPANRIDRIGFLRLSPFAVPPRQRKADPEIYRATSNWHIGYIKKIAGKVLQQTRDQA